MEFELRHYFPGRVRLYAPTLCRRRALAESALSWLRKQNGVTAARINYDCSSLVVEYDKARDGLLRGLIGRLRLLTPAELAVLIAFAGPAQEEPPAGTRRAETPNLVSRRAPLALPTVSVLMALSANPIALAVNVPLMLWNAYPIGSAQRRFPRCARDRRLAGARQPDGGRRRDLADPPRRLDSRPDRGRLAPRRQ
jgi:Cu2+-exporting ATPase